MSPLKKVAMVQRLFSAKEWQQLPADERARRCRLLAFEAVKLAESAGPGLKEAYHALATQWATLADEIEQVSRETLNPRFGSSLGLRIG